MEGVGVEGAVQPYLTVFCSFFIPPSLSPIPSSSLSFPFFFSFLFLLFLPMGQQKASVPLAVAGQLCPWAAGGFSEWLGKGWRFRLCCLCSQPESRSIFWSEPPLTIEYWVETRLGQLYNILVAVGDLRTHTIVGYHVLGCRIAQLPMIFSTRP